MTAEGARPASTARELGRALLARQHLLAPAEATGSPATDVLREITHLVGLQSQAPDPPYVGLWTRLRGFDPQTLGSLLTERRVVRLALLRGTIHLVTAEDALTLHALLAPLFAAQLRTSTQHGKHLAPLDDLELAAAARAALADEPLSPADLGAALALRWPDVPPASLAHGARGLLPLVQVPPRGLWGARGPGTSTRWTTAESWLGRDAPVLEDPAERAAALGSLVLRYLAAFGPATVADVQRWSGLTGLGRVVASIRPLLVVSTGPDGREHLDVADGPRPAAEEPVPARFLPAWDNLLLAHARKERIITEERRRAMFTANGIVHPSILVDGAVVGRWSVRTAPGTATLEVHLLDARLSAAQHPETEAEGLRLLGLLADPAAEQRVVIA
jgi:hypothetical protein